MRAILFLLLTSYVFAESNFDFSKKFSGTFNGKKLEYTAKVYEKVIFERDDSTKPLASFVVTEYSVDNQKNRPVMSSFNGGPGSASLWLHMGVLGPKVVKVPSDASDDGSPPYNLINNKLSPLDKADLVFIDPIGTGYSRPLGEHEGKEFWGVKQDAVVIAEFIRRWINDNNRWNSPRYILGESYGGIRGPLLVSELRSGVLTNIEVNGLLLVSPAADMQYIRFAPGNNSPHYGYLPTYAVTAYYHGKVDTDLTLLEFYENSKKFSLEKYGPALLKGTRISQEEYDEIVKEYSFYTGLSEEFVRNSDLRVEASDFRKELLRDEGFSVGRADSRYKMKDYVAAGQYPDTDASMEGFSSAYVSALHTWFSEIGVETAMLYQSSDRDLYNNWDWNSTQDQKWPRYVNPTPHIGYAQRGNEEFKVYVSCGIYDLATPCFTAENFLYDNGVDMERVIFSEFEAGHMMYNHQPSFDRFLKEVNNFLKE